MEIFRNISPEQAKAVIGRLLKNRIIFLGETIDDKVSKLIISQMLLLDGEDQEKSIDFYLNSNGGAVSSSLAIYDCMQNLRAPVSTICLKRVAGTGSLLLAAGRKGKRYIFKGAQVVLCQLHVKGMELPVDDPLELAASGLLKSYEKLAGLFEKHTGKPKDEIYHDMMKCTIFSEVEAVGYGLVDGVIESSALV